MPTCKGTLLNFCNRIFFIMVILVYRCLRNDTITIKSRVKTHWPHHSNIRCIQFFIPQTIVIKFVFCRCRKRTGRIFCKRCCR